MIWKHLMADFLRDSTYMQLSWVELRAALGATFWGNSWDTTRVVNYCSLLFIYFFFFQMTTPFICPALSTRFPIWGGLVNLCFFFLCKRDMNQIPHWWHLKYFSSCDVVLTTWNLFGSPIGPYRECSPTSLFTLNIKMLMMHVLMHCSFSLTLYSFIRILWYQ